jgi:hypothetical protein
MVTPSWYKGCYVLVMKFGLFFEHQVPRPWAVDNDRRVLTEALEQIELADSLGFDTAWVVEHHFLEEYSHSSAPDVFLGAASQRTKRIRLGHGIVHLLPAINHPARVAERVATLDLLSGAGSSSARAKGRRRPNSMRSASTRSTSVRCGKKAYGWRCAA